MVTPGLYKTAKVTNNQEVCCREGEEFCIGGDNFGIIYIGAPNKLSKPTTKAVQDGMVKACEEEVVGEAEAAEAKCLELPVGILVSCGFASFLSLEHKQKLFQLNKSKH